MPYQVQITRRESGKIVRDPRLCSGSLRRGDELIWPVGSERIRIRVKTIRWTGQMTAQDEPIDMIEADEINTV
jgi:hypothetical protein